MKDTSALPKAQPAYPDIDGIFRNHSALVLAGEDALATYVDSTKEISANVIKEFLQKLQNKCKNFEKLAERINAHYMMVKRELSGMSEKEAKAEEERKHAVEKAKDYRANFKFLEQKVVSKGISTEEISHWYAQERKRKRDEEASPPRKVFISGEKTRMTPTPTKQQERTPPQSSPTSSSSSSTFRIPTTHVPRSK
ncbi:hypothetical protein K458DRAFT_398123 [Lentithecium fluviatile CBS 122367]|uniref:Uncharacterized protein n=1 Tax=Lentithecium fluviatile CBS 122367 TaxID=1168545 RepID=A0A6G1JMI3_9PLEO|nr:hypothetical protein K458DRAFT_398123 [Lentithecium fluviatile CBS 122367]